MKTKYTNSTTLFILILFFFSNPQLLISQSADQNEYNQLLIEYNDKKINYKKKETKLEKMLMFLNKINTRLNVQIQNLEKNKKIDSLKVYEDIDRLENELLELQSNLFALRQVSLDEKEIKTYKDKIISLQKEINDFDEKKEKEFIILVKSIANKQIDIEEINEKLEKLKNKIKENNLILLTKKRNAEELLSKEKESTLELKKLDEQKNRNLNDIINDRKKLEAIEKLILNINYSVIEKISK